eukprot:SAG22_NODE_886_length_6665_cov_3.040359_7_plen_477_part_00
MMGACFSSAGARSSGSATTTGTAAAAAAAAAMGWSHVASPAGAEVTFRGCSAVSAACCFVGGTGGTVLKTTTGGESWADVSPPGCEALQFRDVHAVSADTVFILSIGDGRDSRILKTTTGGASWRTLFTNEDEDAFYNCLKLWPDGLHGVCFSDCVGGKFRIITTCDGGESWAVVGDTALPAARDGEGAFAASGKNIAVRPGGLAWVGLGAGAGPTARVLRTRDYGASWRVADTPLASGPSAGLFSLAFRTDRVGVGVGGDYAEEDVADGNVVVTQDGGETWALATGAVGGFRSVAQYVLEEEASGGGGGGGGGGGVGGGGQKLLVVLGPSGAELSRDDGSNFSPAQAPAAGGMPPSRGLHTCGSSCVPCPQPLAHGTSLAATPLRALTTATPLLARSQIARPRARHVVLRPAAAARWPSCCRQKPGRGRASCDGRTCALPGNAYTCVCKIAAAQNASHTNNSGFDPTRQDRAPCN